jgi:hypothetical protein
VDKAPVITQDIGIQPALLHATALEEPPTADDGRKKQACITADCCCLLTEIMLVNWLRTLLLHIN